VKGDGAMTIYRLFQNSAFGPEEIGYITAAYEDALRVLGLANRGDAITEIVAKKVIEIAQTGERNPVQIRLRAIAELGVPPFVSESDQTTSTDHTQDAAQIASNEA
jgi:hypothetical protein